jgi:glucose-6-phosphate dehydrogenase assembly protein OpcA
MRTGQNTNVRTSVLNLVICAPDIESAQRASALLRDLASSDLARVSVLILDDSNTTAISTWVTLRCFSIISDIMRHCFEQTTILATGAAVRSIANILQPLLKPHLPVYLWWLGDPPGSDILFNSLVELSNRVIVDSTSFYNPEQDMHTLALLRQAAPDCALSDLNWGRITPWRQLIAQFFDVTEYRPYLDGVTSLEIEHAAVPLAMQTRTEQGDVSPNPACALLLAGWLKARLGWSLVANSTRSIHDTASGTYLWQMEHAAARMVSSPRRRTGKLGTEQAASISIHPQVQSNMRPGSICLVRLTSSFEGKQATFTINREGDPDHVLTSVVLSRETRPQRTVSLAATDKESVLLQDELEITGHDHLFEETLQEVAELVGY